jgi:hypothetical protein
MLWHFDMDYGEKLHYHCFKFFQMILFRIVQLNHECKPFIHAYQTSDVMLRVIMMVSHNLDSEIRALFLMLLEGLAAVVREDSHICPFMVVAK